MSVKSALHELLLFDILSKERIPWFKRPWPSNSGVHACGRDAPIVHGFEENAMKLHCSALWFEGLACACVLASPPAWCADPKPQTASMLEGWADGERVVEPDPCAHAGASARCWLSPTIYSAQASRGFWDEDRRREAIVSSWPTGLEWAESSAIVSRGADGQKPWMTGLAAAVGGYKRYDALRSNARSTGVGRFFGIASDRLEILPGRMGQDSGAKGVVGLSLYSCRARCLDSTAIRKLDVSLVFNPRGENRQRQVVLGAKMLFQ
jgi:hypothetical protein